MIFGRKNKKLKKEIEKLKRKANIVANYMIFDENNNVDIEKDELDYIFSIIDTENDERYLSTYLFMQLISTQIETVKYWLSLKRPVKSQLDIEINKLQFMFNMIKDKNIGFPKKNNAHILWYQYNGNVRKWINDKLLKEEE